MAITLQDVYRRLSHNEFSNLLISDEGSGDIRDDKKEQVVSLINNALDQIFTRFPIRTDSVLIKIIEGRIEYELHPKWAFSNQALTDLGEPFIIDTPSRPFKGDVIKILSVKDQFNEELPLNEEGRFNSVFTPRYNVLAVTDHIKRDVLGITYQAFHPLIFATNSSIIVDIPRVILEPLAQYVAHQYYKTKNTQESKAAAQDHFNAYEMACQRIDQNDLIGSMTMNSGSTFEMNGFV